MNSLIYKASEYQGEVFALSITNSKCSSYYFMWRYLISDVADFLDQDVMNFAVNSPGYIIYNLSLENKSINQKKGEKLSNKVMYWAGFIYRFLCASKKISSKRAYHLLKPEKMVELYPSLHTQSPEYVINYIYEKVIHSDINEDIKKIKNIYRL